MRIWYTSLPSHINSDCTIGEIAEVSKDGILTKCSDGYILIKEVQFDSSKRMSVADYIRGHNINAGEKLGK
jgi:methionyl-tRNA formyltransferase